MIPFLHSGLALFTRNSSILWAIAHIFPPPKPAFPSVLATIISASHLYNCCNLGAFSLMLTRYYYSVLMRTLMFYVLPQEGPGRGKPMGCHHFQSNKEQAYIGCRRSVLHSMRNGWRDGPNANANLTALDSGGLQCLVQMKCNPLLQRWALWSEMDSSSWR